MDKPKIQFIILHETLTESIIKDITTFVMILAVILIGWSLESSAMQWAGLIMLASAALARGRKDTIRRLTAQQATDHLCHRFGVRPSAPIQSEGE